MSLHSKDIRFSCKNRPIFIIKKSENMPELAQITAAVSRTWFRCGVLGFLSIPAQLAFGLFSLLLEGVGKPNGRLVGNSAFSRRRAFKSLAEPLGQVWKRCSSGSKPGLAGMPCGSMPCSCLDAVLQDAPSCMEAVGRMPNQFGAPLCWLASPMERPAGCQGCFPKR